MRLLSIHLHLTLSALTLPPLTCSIRVPAPALPFHYISAMLRPLTLPWHWPAPVDFVAIFLPSLTHATTSALPQPPPRAPAPALPSPLPFSCPWSALCP